MGGGELGAEETWEASYREPVARKWVRALPMASGSHDFQIPSSALSFLAVWSDQVTTWPVSSSVNWGNNGAYLHE